jgi:hypothetical protein
MRGLQGTQNHKMRAVPAPGKTTADEVVDREGFVFCDLIPV